MDSVSNIMWFKRLLATGVMCFASTYAFAAGMLPETTVIILNEADGETSLNVKNTDPQAALLYSRIENIPEDTEQLVVLTPPVARLEANETQLVRFIKQSPQPLKVQRLKRVIFEGINQNPRKPGQAQIGVTFRQNLPLIIHPSGLPKNSEPWKLLKWSISNNHLVVKNDSPYVARLAQNVQLLPINKSIDLRRSYVLAGETISIPTTVKATTATSVRISPATVYGFSVDYYSTSLQQ